MGLAAGLGALFVARDLDLSNTCSRVRELMLDAVLFYKKWDLYKNLQDLSERVEKI